MVVCLVLPQTGSDAVAQQADAARALEALLEEGARLIDEGRVAEALDHFTRTVALSEQADDFGARASSLAGLGWALWGAGRYAEALETRGEALALYRDLADAAGETRVLKGLGETLFSLGRYQDALGRYREALDANRRMPSIREEGLILSNMGSAYRFLGRYDEAERVLQAALALQQRPDDERLAAQTLTFLGIVQRAKGEFDAALASYGRALEHRRAAADRRGESQVLGNTGNVYLDLGQPERAVEQYLQSLSIAEEIGYTTQVGFSHQNLGLALSRLGRTRAAIARQEQALAIWQEMGRRPQIGWTLHNLGGLHLHALGDVPRAREILAQALAVAREIKEPDLEGYALADLGVADLRAGDAAAALGRFDGALAAAVTGAGPDLEYRARAERARALRVLGRTEEAIAEFRASVAIVNDLRANVSSDRAKIGFLDHRQVVFHDLARVLVEAGRPAEALEAVEAGRARAFADLLLQREVLAGASPTGTGAAVRAALAAARLPAAQAGGDLDRGLDDLRSENEELASLMEVESPTAGEMQAIAARLGATLVEYLVADEQTFIWVVPPAGEIRVAASNAGRERLAGLVRDLRERIDRADLEALGRPQDLAGPLGDLHRLLIEPIARWLPRSPEDTVVIVPDGPLAVLPFPALVDSQGHPLAAAHTLAFAPAISIFRFTAAKRQPRGSGPPSALVVADPGLPPGAGLERLPGTRDEARRVAAALGLARGDVLFGEQASEAAVKRLAGDRRLLHFATHGLISEDRLAASSLLLNKGEGEDGYLRVDEVFGLRLQADLVVLSGCSTGLGRLTGDGIFGLTRAFIYAGTPSVIVSKWDVSDLATAFLMERFYVELGGGRHKAAALRSAQLAARERYPHPALWAAFVLVGEPR